MPRGFNYAGFRWNTLASVNIADVAKALNNSELNYLISGEHSTSFFESMTKRLAMELEGKSLMFVIYDKKKIIGMTGLRDYTGLYGTLQISTYILPEYWGTGLNIKCKSLLWTLVEMLGHDSVMASINIENTKSQKALLKHHPTAKSGIVYEFWHPRNSMLVEIIDPPEGKVDLSTTELRALKRVLNRTTAYQRWLKRERGKKIEFNYDENATELHADTLYHSVSRVLSEQARDIRRLGSAMPDNKIKAMGVLEEASQQVAEAQYRVAEEIIQVASESDSVAPDAHTLVSEAIIEIKEWEGEKVSEEERVEIKEAISHGDMSLIEEIVDN